jgi:tetratricopeptide (TPR) repeat protein
VGADPVTRESVHRYQELVELADEVGDWNFAALAVRKQVAALCLLGAADEGVTLLEERLSDRRKRLTSLVKADLEFDYEQALLQSRFPRRRAEAAEKIFAQWRPVADRRTSDAEHLFLRWGQALLETQRVREARQVLDELVAQVTDESGGAPRVDEMSHPMSRWAQFVAARAALRDCDLVAAERLWEGTCNACRQSRAADLPAYRPLASLNYVRALRGGAPEEVTATFEQLATMYGDRPDAWIQRSVNELLRAELLTRWGSPEDALTLLRQLQAVMLPDAADLTARRLRLEAVALLSTGRPEEARRVLGQAPCPQPPFMLYNDDALLAAVWAHTLIALGNPEGEVLADSAERYFSQIEDLGELALLRLGRAAALAAVDPVRARTLAVAARETLMSIGDFLDARRAERLLVL